MMCFVYLSGGVSASDTRLGALFCGPRKAAVVEIELENRRVCDVYMFVCIKCSSYVHIYICIHSRQSYHSLVCCVGSLVVHQNFVMFSHVLTTTLPRFQNSTLNPACFLFSILSSSTLVNSEDKSSILHLKSIILPEQFGTCHLHLSGLRSILVLGGSCFSTLARCVKSFKKPHVFLSE